MSVNEKAIPSLPVQAESYMLDGGWLCMLHEGRVLRSRHTGLDGQEINPVAVLYAEKLCRRLNREIGLDGSWLVGLTDFAAVDPDDTIIIGQALRVDPKRLLMIFADADGDTQFVVDTEDDFIDWLMYEDQYVADCFQAFMKTRENEKELEITPADKIKAALGERSADPSASPDNTLSD